MDERLFWVGLTLVKGIGAARFKTLLEVFGNPQSAWEAPGPSLRQAGLPQKVVDQVFFWARKRAALKLGAKKKRPMIYFQPALVRIAKKMDVKI